MKWSELKKDKRFWFVVIVATVAVTGLSVSLTDGKLTLKAEVDVAKGLDLLTPSMVEAEAEDVPLDDDDSGDPGP
jgi:hypothetical protein